MRAKLPMGAKGGAADEVLATEGGRLAPAAEVSAWAAWRFAA